MKKFNLRKKAESGDFVITDKMVQENRRDMNLCNDSQGVVEKNVNLSMPIKNKDNTVPFNVQLDAARKNETKFSIIEDFMNKDIKKVGDDTKQVMDINVKTQEYDTEKTKALKNAEEKSKMDTKFWDKYVGLQMEGKSKNVSNNIPASASQLHNKPERFNDKEIKKMVMASLKDADAMLFHIYATASKEKRDLNGAEKQQVVDINYGKMRLLSQMVEPVKRSLEHSVDLVFKKEKAGEIGVYENNKKVDEFKDYKEAKMNYPEGEKE